MWGTSSSQEVLCCSANYHLLTPALSLYKHVRCRTYITLTAHTGPAAEAQGGGSSTLCNRWVFVCVGLNPYID